MKVCTFFGHRDAWHQDQAQLENAVREAIVVHGCSSFWCGGYGAFDSAAATAVRRLKTEYPHIELVLVYAYLPVEKDPRADGYDATLLPDGLETVPKRLAIPRRNDWMARRCDLAIVRIDRDYGGAFRTWQLLQRRGVPILQLGTWKP